MLRWLRKELRLKTAIAVALLYAISILTPGVAVAFGDAPAHCLSEVNALPASDHDEGSTHVHADGSAHHHHAATEGAAPSHDSDGKGQPDKCCGLFQVSALAHHDEVRLAGPPPFAFDFPALEDKLTGRGADRLYRPPNI